MLGELPEFDIQQAGSCIRFARGVVGVFPLNALQLSAIYKKLNEESECILYE